MRSFHSSSPISRSYSEPRGYDFFEPITTEVPVRIRSYDREERTALLQISTSLANVPGSHHQVLQIQITEEQDPFLLYALELGEAEFHCLKQEQCILVDFLIFPHKLIELLEMCKRESAQFLCLLDRHKPMEASLNVVETNLFKQLTHISLKFKGGSDEVVRTHLAAKLKEFKLLAEELEYKLRTSNESLAHAREELQGTSRDYENLKADLERKMEERKLEETQRLHSLKQEMLQSQYELKSRHEQETQDSVKHYEDSVKETREKLELMTAQFHELSSTKYALESREREISNKLRQTEHELELAQNELSMLRSTNKSLDASKYENERKLTEAKLTIQNLERQLQDKEELNAKLTDLLETNNEHKGQQEDTLAMLKATVSKLEDKLHQSANEINKGNSIIQKLQGEIKAGKQKLKLKNTVVLQQENVIQQKQEAIDSANKETNDLRREIERRDDRAREAEQNVLELKAKLDDAQKTLQSNSSTIQWLNGRLNDAEKTRIPYTSTYKPGSSGLAFKPSAYTMEQFKTAASPMKNSDMDFAKLLEPIKYKEPE